MSTHTPGSALGIVILYRWRLHPGTEDAFTQAWSRMTELLRSRGSLGSRLHQGSDGLWYGYAQWPNAKSREDAFADGSPDEETSARMKSAIAEQFPEIILVPVAGHLVAPKDVKT